MLTAGVTFLTETAEGTFETENLIEEVDSALGFAAGAIEGLADTFSIDLGAPGGAGAARFDVRTIAMPEQISQDGNVTVETTIVNHERQLTTQTRSDSPSIAGFPEVTRAPRW